MLTDAMEMTQLTWEFKEVNDTDATRFYTSLGDHFDSWCSKYIQTPGQGNLRGRASQG
jgi:hypothetical protein